MAEPLPLEAVIGFGGQVDEGLILHPDGKTLIYPLGSAIILRNKDNINEQEFLQGHTDKVSCLALSPSGRFLASGQLTFMGFAADIIIWDLETRELKHRMQLQKVKIQQLDFSPNEQFLASLGGQDDNSLVLWDVATGAPICGSPTHADFTLKVKFLNNCNHTLITAGKGNLHVWEYDEVNNKLRPHAVKLGNLQRSFNCLAVSPTDDYAYCGTTSGDVLQVNIGMRLFKNNGPAKGMLAMGVTAVCTCPSMDEVLVGTGDGALALLKVMPEPANPKHLRRMPILAKATVEGRVTSVFVDKATAGEKGFVAYVGTDACNMYLCIFDRRSASISCHLAQTAHSQKINGLAFPYMCSDVFATCSIGEIRVWHIKSCRELLRITVPNLECHCVSFTHDGKNILSGWSDGKIRSFGPQSGKLLFCINNAHHKAVTAIASTSDCRRIVSGGAEGMVRVWQLGDQSQPMLASMKEHKGAVNGIIVKCDTDDECVSASSDGSTIVWDLATNKRRNSLFANTFFKAVAYHPDHSQIVTTGTDRKITYWDTYDGNAIRITDGSDTDQCNSLAVDVDGRGIVSGASDKLVKLWGYDEGHCYYVGVGHSGAVTGVAITVDKSKICSVGTEGGIFVWTYMTISSPED